MFIRDLISRLTDLAEIHAQQDEPEVFIELPGGHGRVVTVRLAGRAPDGAPRIVMGYTDPPALQPIDLDKAPRYPTGR